MGGGNIETEVKIAVAAADEARRRILAAGFAEIQERSFEANDILDWPGNSLRSQGRLLRVRNARGECILTYKGPAAGEKHKSREEIETRVADPANLAAILERLGMSRTLRYEKYRTEFARPGDAGVVTIDETPIGAFLELEGPPDWIDATAKRLGFDESAYVTLSYARLYTEWCAAQGREPGIGMVFTASAPPRDS